MNAHAAQPRESPGRPAGHPGSGSGPAPRHAREWAFALALALLGHALVLGSAPPSPGAGREAAAARAPALVVRRLEAPVAAPSPVLPAVAAPPQAAHAAAAKAPPPTAAAAEAAQATAGPAVRPAAPAPDLRAAPAANRIAQAAPGVRPDPATPPVAAARPDPAAGRAGAQAEADPDAPEGEAVAAAYAGRAPPVLATRIAPAFVQGYTLRRGGQAGRAELRLERGEGQYRLSLRGRVEGGRPLEQTSQGSFDAAGVAPERFLDRRRGRGAQAANFDRDRGRITYSGPGVVQPLFAGAQDRLSWIVQLAAVVQAEPARWGAGTRVPLYVSGARGDADLWLFEVRGRAALELPGEHVPEALHLVREPQRPYDSRVEVWLDPARHHLPALLRFTQVPQGGGLELVREP